MERVQLCGLILILFSGLVHSWGTNSYRGGTISYRPTSSYSNRVEFSYRLAFDLSYVYCNSGNTGYRVPWTYGGSRAWDVTTYYYYSGSYYQSISYSNNMYCRDFNIEEGWSEGNNSFILSSRSTTSAFVAKTYNYAHWIRNVSRVDGYGSMLLSATANASSAGFFNNSSPVSSLPLTVYVDQGIPSVIKIPVQDPDGDIVRCRNASYQECYRGMCTYFPHGVLDEGNCTLRYNGGGSAGQLFPIILKLEDFPPWTTQFDSSNSLGSVDLQFVVHIINDTAVRIQGGGSSGRLQVLHNGVWGTVCDDYWTMNNTHVVCRQLGFDGVVSYYNSGGGTGPIWLDDVRCYGNESAIQQCRHRGWGSHNCGHGEDVFVTCINNGNNTCASSPCRNNGKCVITYYGYRCYCPYGYSGTQCETNVYPCHSNPCRNGGSCRGGYGWYYCSCPSGYTGQQCQTHVFSECNNYTVLNTADRAANYRGITYKCDYYDITKGWYRFMGDAGTAIATSCVDSSHCGTSYTGWMNGSHPTEADGIVTRHVCYSSHRDCCRYYNTIRVRNCGGFFLYELVKPPTCNFRYCGSNVTDGNYSCDGNPCLNGASCFNRYDGYRCYCRNGFNGKNCETVPYPCSNDPCRNGGTCSGGYDWYYCSCPSGYTGQQCQHAVARIQGGGYSGRLQVLYNGVWGTVCDDYWTMTHTHVVCRQLGFDGAVSYYNSGGGTGPIWLDDVSCSGNETAIQQCRHRGWGRHDCSHSEDVFVTCYRNAVKDPCASRPCRNNGTCATTSSSYRCYCPYGYSGTQCETSMYPCTSNPCRNGGSCRGGYGWYRCNCRSGYTGRQCETVANDPCSCLNGGTCRYSWYAGYRCECPSGYTGKICEKSFRTNVTCDESYMQIDLEDKYFPDIDWRNLHLKDSSCRATKTPDTSRLRTPLNRCGTTYTETQKTITFWNEIKIDNRYQPSGNGSSISRNRHLNLRFFCSYERSRFVSTSFSPSKKTVVASEGSYGNFTFTMDLYQSSNYSAPYSPFDYPVVVYPNQPLWVQYEVKNTNADLVVFAENCRATTSTDPDSFPQHVFLERGCVRDRSMSYWHNPYSNVQQFSIRSFRFVYSNTFLVYLHCELLVCHRNTNNSRCAQGCISGSRRRRETDDTDGSNLYDLSAGPLKGGEINAKGENQEGSSTSEQLIGGLGAVGGVFFVITILLSVIVYRNRRRGQDNKPTSIALDVTVNSYEQDNVDSDENKDSAL